MTDFEAYQEYIQRRHNAFCKAVIRYAARDKILQLRRIGTAKFFTLLLLLYRTSVKWQGFTYRIAAR